jgi:ApaG protein
LIGGSLRFDGLAGFPLMSNAVTQGIRVRIHSRFLEEQSKAGKYVFVYTVQISNESDQAAQLVSRHWVITDAHGHEEHVQGDGVVGRKPLIRPGEAHEYSSFCPLSTPHGSMRGSYRMVRPNGDAFDAEIAPFALVVPRALN